MKKKSKFVALGGGQEIGASSYFLNIDNKNFLFDCGKGIKDTLIFGPDFGTILQPPFLTSLSQIDNIFISHGHFDHIGYLPDLIEQCANTQVLATEVTKELGKYLMWDSYTKMSKILSPQRKIAYDLQCSNALNRIQPVSYNQKLLFSDYQVTFFEAGHIPGAAMIYIETDNGNVLYTGDFSLSPTPLSEGYIIPSKINPDTIILCGVHAKHPNYRPIGRTYFDLIPVKQQLENSNSVYLTMKQLTKGLEILQIIINLIENGKFPDVHIFVDDNLWELSQRFSNIGRSVLNKNCYRFPNSFSRPKLGLYIGFGSGHFNFKNNYKIDFSLHAIYDDIKSLIGKYMPKNVIVVHSADDRDGINKYALQKEFYELNFIYAQNGQIYLV